MVQVMKLKVQKLQRRWALTSESARKRGPEAPAPLLGPAPSPAPDSAPGRQSRVYSCLSLSRFPWKPISGRLEIKGRRGRAPLVPDPRETSANRGSCQCPWETSLNHNIKSARVTGRREPQAILTLPHDLQSMIATVFQK